MLGKDEPQVTHRHEINRQSITKKRVSEFVNSGKVDAVIIGSGMSGLTVAGMLSRAGWRVAVLEQHDVAGGTTHQFVENGFEFGTGLHYTGDSLPRSTLLDTLTDGKLQWAEMDPEYDRAILMGSYEEDRSKEESFVFTKGFFKLRRRLHERFPDEKAAIDKYFFECAKYHTAMLPMTASKVLPGMVAKLVQPLLSRLYTKFSSKSTLEVMRECGLSDKTIGVLSYIYGDVGTTPDKSPFMVHGMLTCHWFRGAFYPVGGPEQIAVSMIPTIERAGGKVWVNARVDQILLGTDGAVEGVRVKGMDILCNKVVSSAGAINTFVKMLDGKMPLPPQVKQLRSELTTRTTLKPGMGMICLFIGLEGTVESLNVGSYNTWLVSSWDHAANINKYMKDPLDAQFPMVFIAFSSAKDPSAGSRMPNKVSCEMLAPMGYELFEEYEHTKWNKRGNDYEALKEVLTEKMLDVLYKRFPQLKGKVIHNSLGTPLTNNHFMNSSRGEVYALDHTVERFAAHSQSFLNPKTPIKGLYVTGQDVLFSGVVTAFFSGIMTVACMSYIAMLKNVDVLFRATPKIYGEKYVTGIMRINVGWTLSVLVLVFAIFARYVYSYLLSSE
eukprot:CFRG6953T1